MSATSAPADKDTVTDIPSVDRPNPPAAFEASRQPEPQPVRQRQGVSLGLVIVLILMLAIAAVAAWLAWDTQQRLISFRETMTQRQQEVQNRVDQASTLVAQSRDVGTRIETRVDALQQQLGELAVQRQQVENMMTALSRTRDESVLAEIDAALRVATQQVGLVGSTAPLVQALRQGLERVDRLNQPSLAALQVALKSDLDAVQAVSMVDVADLALKLDTVGRGIDELPLLADAAPASGSAAVPASSAAAAPAAGTAATGAAPAAAASQSLPADAPWWQRLWAWLSGSTRELVGTASKESQSFFRVTRVDSPEALLLAPDQSLYLRKNLQLVLLEARIALLSRQFALVRSDIAQVDAMLGKYFDATSARVQAAREQLKTVSDAAQDQTVPEPTATRQALQALGSQVQAAAALSAAAATPKASAAAPADAAAADKPAADAPPAAPAAPSVPASGG
ncbi:uroporphyrinogen-III C-methyltransferase [Amphibiibacter pelophylacis]|uniref:Uroporphyrinogen-III C-methyltransferase n=1 Tax=Amphibiibacter pelophylacis TaxID=1799477 RepID=A0ACC6P2M8_9BURK